MNPLDLVKLTPLMALTTGRPELIIGLIDGPVALSHPDLARQNIRGLPGRDSSRCTQADSTACAHGTFVAGMLCARRGAAAAAICPDCTLLASSIFADTPRGHEPIPSATPGELAGAILGCINAGARVVNISAALLHSSARDERQLGEVLDYSARRGVIVVAAAGNQGTVGSTVITRHSWVIPVGACDCNGRPLNQSNLGSSIGRRGLSAPGENITSLGIAGKPVTSAGTSVAAPFVTGAIALLWSEFPNATPGQIRMAFKPHGTSRRMSIVPAVLDAWTAYQALLMAQGRSVRHG